MALVYDQRSRSYSPTGTARLVWMASVALLAVAVVALAVVVRANPASELDRRLLEEIGAWGDTSLRGWYSFLSSVTGMRPALLIMFASVIVMTVVSRPNNGVALAVTLLIVGSADLLSGYLLSVFVGVERPNGAGGSLSFPSGHVAFVTSLCIVMVYIAYTRNARPAVLAALAVLAGFVIFSIGVSRLVLDDHWPSDVLGGYLLGVLGPLLFIPLYHRLERVRWTTPPRVGIEVPAPDSADAIIAGSYGSAVIIEPSKGTATKYFDPPVLLRALYWVSFQKGFPYTDNPAALDAAVYRRRIAGLLTRYRFGKDLVAPIRSVEWQDGKASLVTEFIAGKEPANNQEAWKFLSEVSVTFEEAGLPGWQLNPHNPHAHTNLIRNAEGDFMIVDMESGFVTPFPSRGQVRASLKHGTLPVFDDMDFERLYNFVAEREADLLRRLGPDGYAELKDVVEQGEKAYHRWREGELRLWGRTVRFIYRLLNIRADFALARRGMAGAQQRAARYMEQGLARWQSEGLISEQRAQEVRVSLADPNVQVAMEHFGALMLISVVFRFPLGSIIRFVWVLVFMVRASDAMIRRRKNGSGGLTVHNPAVLFFAAIPGFGAIAYIFSGPLMKPLLVRLALDQAAHEMPWGIYRKLRIGRWLPPRPKAVEKPK